MQRNVNVQIVVQESMTKYPLPSYTKKHGAHTSNGYFPSASLHSFVEGQSSKLHMCVQFNNGKRCA